MPTRLIDSINRRDGELRESVSDLALAVTILLLEVSYADERISGEEMERIRTILARQFGIDEDEVKALVKEARGRWIKTEDVWSYVTELNRNLVETERRQVLAAIWQVIYADKNLHEEEEYYGYQLASRMGLTLSDVHAAQSLAKSRSK